MTTTRRKNPSGQRARRGEPPTAEHSARIGQVLSGTPWPAPLLDILRTGGLVARLGLENLLLEESR